MNERLSASPGFSGSNGSRPAGHWEAVLHANGLGRFEALWELDIGWLEGPNRRRSGWSGVSRWVLELPGGGQAGIFIKRQENYFCHTLLHPFLLAYYGQSRVTRQVRRTWKRLATLSDRKMKSAFR